MKTANKKNSPAPRAIGPSPLGSVLPFLGGLLYFIALCLCGPSSIKGLAGWLICGGIVAAVILLVSALSRSPLQDRLSAPVILMVLICLMGGISTFYAVSGKFALYEFLKPLCSLCLVLLLLVLCRGDDPGRSVAQVLATASALAGLTSIDLLSTRLVSGGILGFLGAFTTDYADLAGVEPGVRMTGIFDNPNIFAGVVGLGVLLSLALTVRDASAPEGERPPRWVQVFHVSLLYINSLAFVLAFSMGASGAIALAFLVYLLLETPQRRPALLVLMMETLLLAALAAAIISAVAFQSWSGFQPAPLLLVVLGTAGLWALDRFVGSRLAKKLKGKVVLAVIAAVLAVLVVFVLVAYHWTGEVSLKSGQTLRRAIYPAPGEYSLSVMDDYMDDYDSPVHVRIESQNQQQTMMHTSTVLYNGPAVIPDSPTTAHSPSFTVPADSLVVYFNFTVQRDVRLYAAGCTGGPEVTHYSVPLGYPLLPGFIANRLQGLWANQNAIQRFVFFSDGMKLFQRSPVVGLGMGAFENGIRSVQSFDYETKYAHNHYIQTLVETGVIGLVLFVGLLATSAACVLLARRKKDDQGVPTCHPMVPALGAALVFMAAHAATEVVFSAYGYLPIAFGSFCLIGLCCGDALPFLAQIKRGVKAAFWGVVTAGLLIFGVLLLGNIMARSMVDENPTMDTLITAADTDVFEWADFALSYVNSAMSMEGPMDAATQAQADRFSQRLAKVDSNTIPIYLAEYYFRTQRPEPGFQMIEKYLNYVSSHAEAWQTAFHILEAYDDGTPEYRQGVGRVAQMLEDWNRDNMGTITPDEQAQAYLDRLGQ